MASIRKRGDSWQARVNRKGYPEQIKSFTSRNDAAAWARLLESEFDKGIFVSRTEAENTTLKELLNRYLLEVTPYKKGAQVERYRINAWLKSSLANRFLSTLRTTDFAAWRDNRIKTDASPNTIRLELAVISHMFNIAKVEWGFESLSNPTENLRLPKLSKGRTRRVSDTEIELIIKHTESYELPPILKLALETGMRRGEIASLVWANIDLSSGTALLPCTKNGDSRTVPLSSKCIVLLKSLPRRIDGQVFGMTAHAITYAFIRATKRAGLSDIHVHDVRHEAVSRLFERGFSLPEVAAISGHKTWAMLKRYTHLKAEELAKKMG